MGGAMRLGCPGGNQALRQEKNRPAHPMRSLSAISASLKAAMKADKRDVPCARL